MDREDVEDAVSLLQRAHVLDACGDGPVGRTAIAERADCSRTTAYRATGELEERGLVERTADGYRLTGSGRATLDGVREFHDRLDGVEQLGPLLDRLDAPELVRNAELFSEATVLEADAGTPYGIEQHVESILEDTEREIFGVTSSIGSPRTVEAVEERTGEGVEFHYVFTRPAYDSVASQYTELNDAVMARDNVAYYVVDRVAVDFVVYDETLVVVGFGDDGLISAVATTDDGAAVEWARELFESHRQRGERIA